MLLSIPPFIKGGLGGILTIYQMERIYNIHFNHGSLVIKNAIKIRSYYKATPNHGHSPNISMPRQGCC